MTQAILPSPRPGRPPSVPELRFAWRDARASAAQIAEFTELTGLPPDPLPLLFPHVFGFRLIMALLTDRRFPLPIWNALQVRNRLRQHQSMSARDTFDIETRVTDARVLAKGLEVDLHTSFSASHRLAWESVVTFYYRGIFGEPVPPLPDAAPPAVAGPEVAQWRAAIGQGRRFARLTGDYNGIHWSKLYARAFGFRGAFHHPQRAVGQALAHVRIDAARPTQRLDVWLRGQVYEGSRVRLRAEGNDPLVFDLTSQDDPRPAIVARWSAAG